MNRGDLMPLQRRAHIPATCKATDGVLSGAGREITRLTVIVERQGD
jgi:hypothetical protein